MPRLPYVSAAVPGIGGRTRTEPSDFEVSEIPAYPASGSGDHWLCHVEKRGLTTFDLVQRIAAAAGVSERDIGTAGLKDKHAVTRQYLSVPATASESALREVESSQIRILEIDRHKNKLKTGHLRGNRFRICIRDIDDNASAAVREIAEVLSLAPGAPNWFGAQRFGQRGETAEQGRRLVLAGADGKPAKGPRGRRRRLYISAFQSLLFNELLARRIAEGGYRILYTGDLAQIHGHTRTFVVEDAATETARLVAGELCATGPMFGHKMRSPGPGPAADMEADVLAAHDLTPASFAHLGKLALGTRRALAVPLRGFEMTAGDGLVWLAFDLPPGSYATAILREFMKSPEGESA